MTNLPGTPQYDLNRRPRVDYGELVNSSFRILWNHRILWLAGILTVLLQGGTNSPNFNYSFNSRSFPGSQPGEPPVIPDFQAMIQGTIIEDIINNPMPFIVLAAGIAVIGILVQFIFGTWAQAAMIRMVDDIETTGSTALGRGWGQARRRLGSLLGYKVLLFFPILLLGLLGLVAFLPIFLTMMQSLALPPEQMEQAMSSAMAGPSAGLFCLFPIALCIMFPLFAFILVIDLYGFRSCLLGGTGPWRSITRGWQLFRQEMGNTLLTGVFYFILSAIVGVIVLLPALPFGLGMAGRIFNSGFTFDMLWSLIPIFIYMMIAGLVMGGLIRAYFAVLCTKLYRVAEAKQTV